MQAGGARLLRLPLRFANTHAGLAARLVATAAFVGGLVQAALRRPVRRLLAAPTDRRCPRRRLLRRPLGLLLSLLLLPRRRPLLRRLDLGDLLRLLLVLALV